MGPVGSRAQAREGRGDAPALFGVLALAYVVPFFGAGGSIAALILAPSLGPRIWPGRSPGRSFLLGVAALLGVWFGAILTLAGVDAPWIPYHMAEVLFPLCGPSGTAATFLPSATALVTYGILATWSVRTDRPWLWPVGAAAATVAVELSWNAVTSSGGGVVC